MLDIPERHRSTVSQPVVDRELTTKVSCTIIAKNEVDRIGRCIASVADLVDEIIVVDSGSTDGTQELCERLGARVIQNAWSGYGPQKRFAEDQARNDWILNLDADEWLSEALREEIRALLKQDRMPASSFRMAVTIVYPHRQEPCLFADSTKCVRLYDRRAARFSSSLVHDSVPPTDDLINLKNRVYHKSFRRLADVVRKELSYFELQTKELKKSKTAIAFRLPFEFPYQFFRYYILSRHIFGGLYGFSAAVTLAYLRFMRLVLFRSW